MGDRDRRGPPRSHGGGGGGGQDDYHERGDWNRRPGPDRGMKRGRDFDGGGGGGGNIEGGVEAVRADGALVLAQMDSKMPYGESVFHVSDIIGKASTSAEDAEADGSLRVAMVCQCNMNRSMAAHKLFLERKHAAVESFGVARVVKLPGPRGPFSFAFGLPYESMLSKMNEQPTQDRAWLRDKHILGMLERNREVKPAPQRWIDQTSVNRFNLVICFEERVYDAVIDDIATRDPTDFKPVHVVNFNTTDTAEAAEDGAEAAWEFVQMCSKVPVEDLEAQLPDILEKLRSRLKADPLITTSYL